LARDAFKGDHEEQRSGTQNVDDPQSFGCFAGKNMEKHGTTWNNMEKHPAISGDLRKIL